MQKLTDYKSVIFDCDGVILQSNQIKTRAFRDALDGEPVKDIDTFINYHQEHGGVSRYVKFEYYYKTIKGDKDFKSLSSMAIHRFSRLVYDGLLNATLVPGVLDVLKFLNVNKSKCYVVSGGDQLELQRVFSERGLNHYFNEILGSPLTKIDNLRILQKNEDLKMPSIFFGDARSDMDAAKSAGIDFCFIYGFSEWENGLDEVINKNTAHYRSFVGLLQRE